MDNKSNFSEEIKNKITAEKSEEQVNADNCIVFPNVFSHYIRIEEPVIPFDDFSDEVESAKTFISNIKQYCANKDVPESIVKIKGEITTEVEGSEAYCGKFLKLTPFYKASDFKNNLGVLYQKKEADLLKYIQSNMDKLDKELLDRIDEYIKTTNSVMTVFYFDGER